MSIENYAVKSVLSSREIFRFSAEVPDELEGKEREEFLKKQLLRQIVIYKL